MFRKKLKQMGTFTIAFMMVIGSVQFPAKAEESNVIEKGENLELPSVSGNDTVRFCADYEQIIGEDGTVYTPLEDKTVKGFFETTNGTDQTVTKGEETTYTVRGAYEAIPNANEKPAVIPELQEWHGKTGTFVISSASKLIISDAKLQDVAEEFEQDYLDITGLKLQEIRVGTRSDAKMCDFYFELTEQEKGLGKEGYVMDIDNAVCVGAEDAVGVYWATRTILQILKQNQSIPKGLVRDYPKYEVRAFSLDVGRKPFTMDALYQFAQNMSWYKMNSFQIHLNDNLIFMEDYKNQQTGTDAEKLEKGLQTAKDQAYAGFRLESGVVNTDENYPELLGKSATSEDLYYTKDEFRQFIKDSRQMGIDIVPEFDMPAHALAFTRAFPQYRTSSETGGRHTYTIDELNLQDPETTEFAKSLWEDYFTGDDPVFDKDTTIHIGTDEFNGTGGNESFRKFSDDMIKFVQGTGRKVRMWGSLSNKSGSTPVASNDVQLNIWSTSYANPANMYNQGFDMINTLVDGSTACGGLYIVPSGTRNRGAYADLLDTTNLYNNWQPNIFSGYTVKAGDDQMLGACFASWHDNIDTRANGITQYDSFYRFMDALPVISAKVWGDVNKDETAFSEFCALASKTGTAPNTNMYAEVDFVTNTASDWTFDETLEKDSSVNGFDLTAVENAKLVNGENAGKALQLNGGRSYAETPLNQVGSNAIITMKVKMDADADTETSEQILCESKEKFGTYGTYAIKASITKNGTSYVGFSREGYDYTFNYTLPENEWVELEFHSGQDRVALYVNGELADDNPEFYFANHPETPLKASRGNAKVATMMVPIGRIGSDTDSFKGQISYVTVTGNGTSSAGYGAVEHSEMTATACSVSEASATEGPVKFAIDDNSDTYWHTDWSNDTAISADHYHWFKVTLENAKTISRLTYLPRQNSESGRILEYSIDVEKENPDGTLTTETVVSRGTWANTTDQKTADFEPVKVKSVTLKILASKEDNVGAHATIAELNLYEPVDAKADLENIVNLCEGDTYQKDSYTDQSWKVLQEAKEEARLILEYESSTEADYLSALGKVRDAIDHLTELDFMSDTEKVRYNLSSAIAEAEEKLKEFEGTKASVSLQAVIAAAKAALENENGSGQTDLSGILSDLKTAGDEDKIISETKETLNTAISEARKKLANTAGYTADSVSALKAAVTAAEKMLTKENVSIKELEEAIENLGKLSLVKEITIPVKDPDTDGSLNGGSNGSELKDGDSFTTVSGVKYQVVSASAKTVKLVKGKDVKTVKINTVTYDSIKYTVVEIANNAYKGCSKKLKTVTIGADVKTIGKNAFKGCKKLTKVTISGKSKLAKVGAGAFKGASKKISVKLPKNLKKNKSIKKQIKTAGIKKGV